MRHASSVLGVLLQCALLSPAIAADGEARLDGPLSPEKVRQFMADHKDSAFKTLTIMQSPGGSGLDSILFGQWLADRKVDVRIVGLCASACANFVFTAGANKTIVPGSLVVWHGSAEQKDIRDRQEQYASLAKRMKHAADTGATLDEPMRQDIANLEAGQGVFAKIEAQRNAQATFFKSIAVDERITRLGQEPHNYGVEWWTATPEVMRTFGIKNVTFPPDYGTQGYLTRNMVLTKMMLRGNVMSFGQDGDVIKPIFLPGRSSDAVNLSISEMGLPPGL